jgi:hypothetical protein
MDGNDGNVSITRENYLVTSHCDVSFSLHACTCVSAHVPCFAAHWPFVKTLHTMAIFKISVTPHPPKQLLSPEHVFLALQKNLLSESHLVLLTYSPVDAQGTAPGWTTSTEAYLWFCIRDDANPFHFTVFVLEISGMCRWLFSGVGDVNRLKKTQIHHTRGGALAFFYFTNATF